MPVLNDFGEAGYQRVVAQLDAFAAQLGIPREIIRQYWSDTAHLPQTLDELKAWGMKPDREYGQIRYDQATGRWNPLATGPTPGKTPEQRGGFPHFITNNVGDAQRFQQVDAQGNIFGGSWDPAANAAHPEWAGRSADAGLRQQIATRGAQGRPFDENNHVAPRAGGFVSVVDGVPNQFPTQQEAEQDFNARTGGGGTAPPAGAAPPPEPVAPTGGGYPSGASGGYPSGVGGTGANPIFNPSAASAANAAVLAFLEQRRIDEIEKPELALKSEVERARMRREDSLAVWKQEYERADLTGKMPDGTPIFKAQEAVGVVGGEDTLKKRETDAALTGYTGEGIGARAARMFATEKAANPAMGGYGPQAAAIWQRLVPSLTPDQALEMSRVANEWNSTSGGQPMPDDVIAQHLGRLGGPAAAASAMGMATPAYQHQQNQDAINAMTLLSNLRGPENAFAYANTIANMPDSIRNTIGAAMQRLPMTARNPAQAGLIGDATGQPQVGAGGPTAGTTSLPMQGSPTGATQAAAVQPMQGAPGGALTQTGQPAMAMSPGVVPGAGMTTQPFRFQGGPTQVGQPALAAAPNAAMLEGLRQRLAVMPAAPPMGATPGQPTMRAAVMPGQGHPVPTGAPAPGGTAPGGIFAGLPPGQQPTGAQPAFPPPPVAFGPRTQPPVRPATAAGMALPSQISPTDYMRTGTYGRNLMWAGYENAGEDKANAQDEYKRSLPRAYGPRTGRRAA